MLTTKEDFAREVLICISLLNFSRTNLHKYTLKPRNTYCPQLPYYQEDTFKKHNILNAQRKKAELHSSVNLTQYRYNMVDYSLESKIGNCEELCLLALVLVCYLNFNGWVTLCFGKEPFDHCFILLMDNKENLPFVTNFQSLPPSSLILDPWLNSYFTPDKAYYYLKGAADYYRWGLVKNLQFSIDHLKYVAYYKEKNKGFISKTLISNRFQLALQEIINKYPVFSTTFQCTATRATPSDQKDPLCDELSSAFIIDEMR